MKKLFLFSLFLLFSQFAFSQNGTLKGKIVDAVTKEPLAGAHLFIKESNKVTVSGNNGEYSISLPLHAKLHLQTTFVGYKPYEFTVRLSGDTAMDILMVTDDALKGVYVYGARVDFGIKNTQMSAISVPIERMESVPALFGEVDVMKVLQKLPGVQSSGDGTSGIIVRGGNYDQNLITLDGSTLYNSEHLKGFVSAINADMIDNLVLYKGGFPARYGARISSIVDIGIKEGNFERIKGSVGIGMLSSKIQLEGPIWRGRTSFNVGARLSYFDVIAMPMLEKVYDKPEGLKPYANMNFYDINAKLVHRFSNKDKISAVFYWGKDVNDSEPTESTQAYSFMNKSYDNKRNNKTENQWGNLVSSLFYTHQGDNGLMINTNLSFSRYDYRLKIASEINEATTNSTTSDTLYKYTENSYIRYNSDINDIALATDLLLNRRKHSIRLGAKISLQKYGPVVDVFKDSYKKIWEEGNYIETSQYVDTLLGANYYMKSFSLYAEDDFELSRRWKLNCGLRYSLYAVKDKYYHSLEPRLSLRFLLNNKMAIKASYSRMAQGLHLLSSTNLVMPSDIWVPVTNNIPLMTSNQWALGYNYNIFNGVDFSVEGYYKTMDNVMEYKEGASYTRMNGDWQEQVVLGKGKAFGVELLLEKKFGKSTGWIGYTWAKSLRKFDDYENVLNGGEEFYAGNDRRHNLNIVFAHEFNEHWKISGSWTFQTGRRGTITTTSIYGGKPNEYDAFGSPFSSELHKGGDIASTDPDKLIYLDKFLRYYTHKQRNGYVLPNMHRLDISATFTAQTSIGDIDISLNICNLYNRMNISNLYIGYHDNQTVLKGVCMFPFMPSLNIVFTF